MNPAFLRLGISSIAIVIGAVLVFFALASGLGYALVGGAAFLVCGHFLFKERGSSFSACSQVATISAEINNDHLHSRTQVASRRMAQIVLGTAVFLILYGVFVALAYRNLTFGAWVARLQPAVEWLSGFIPALREKPKAVLEPDVVAAMQHILFVGWVAWFVVSIWTVLDAAVFHRRDWSHIPAVLINRSVLMKMAFWVFVLAIVVFGALFGGILSRGLSGPAEFPLIALCFSVMAVCVFVIVVCLTSFVNSYAARRQP
jgi:hypothetical protein